MKKRILSLLLAFSMAATLAPATALVGSSTAKAKTDHYAQWAESKTTVASPTSADLELEVNVQSGTKKEVYVLLDGDANGGTADTQLILMPNNTESSANAAKLEVTGVDFEKVKADGDAATGGTGYEADLATLTIEAEPDDKVGTYEMKFWVVHKSAATTQVNIDGPGSANENDVLTLKVKVTAPESDWGDWTSFTHTASSTNLLASAQNRNFFGDAGDTLTFRMQNRMARNATDTGTIYEDEVAAGNRSTPALSATYLATKIELAAQSAATPRPTGYKAGHVVIGDPVVGGTANNIDIEFDGDAPEGTYYFVATQYFTTDSTDGTDIQVKTVSMPFTITIGDTVTVTLLTDGGSVSDALYTNTATDKWVGTFSANTSFYDGTNELLPIPEKKDALFAGWEVANTGVAPDYGTGVPNGRSVTYKATWTDALNDKDTLGNTVFGRILLNDSQGNSELLAAQKLGDKIVTKANYFKRTGYKLVGWSTRPDTNVAMFGVTDAITVDMLKAIKAANNNNSLYAVWQATEFKINFNPGIPEGKKLSQYSATSMDPITWKSSDNITVASWLAKTRNRFHIVGLTFIGWSADFGSTASGGSKNLLVVDLSNGNRDFNNNGRVNLTDLQTTGIDGDITLYATWTNGSTYITFKEESGSDLNSILPVQSSATLKTSSNLPVKAGKTGYYVEKWVNGDDEYEIVSANQAGVEADIVTEPTTINPVYKKAAIKYNMVVGETNTTEYPAAILSDNFTTSHIDTFGAGFTTTILPAREANTATFEGYEAWVRLARAGSMGTQYSSAQLETNNWVKLDGLYKGSFNSVDMIRAMEGVAAASASNGVGGTHAWSWDNNTDSLVVYFKPVWKYNVVDAKLNRQRIVVNYGTSIRTIEGFLAATLQVNVAGVKRDIAGSLPSDGGIASIKLTGSYDSLKEGEYRLTANITPSKTVSPSSAVYSKFVNVEVRSKAASGYTGVVAKEIENLADINLPSGSTVNDVYAALSKLSTIKVKGDNDVEYTLKNGRVAAAAMAATDSEWKYEQVIANDVKNYNVDLVNATAPGVTLDNDVFDDAVGDGLDTALRGPLTFRFVIDVSTSLGDDADSNLAAGTHEAGHLQYAGYDGVGTTRNERNGNIYAVVDVNIGAGTKAPAEPAIPVEDVEKIDSVTTSEAQVHALLDSNYMLRFRNKVTGAHLYTADFTEYVALMVNKNWEHETYISGSNTFKASSKKTSVYTTPVYRLFSSANREHLYTKDFGEVQSLVAGGKWKLDNSTIYVSMDEAGTAYYRQVRNVPVGGGKSVLQHNWAPKAEYDANLANGKGWRADFDGKPVWYSPAN